MVEIPAAFLRRFKDLLGEEFPAFSASLNREPIQGLRVNTLKTEAQKLSQRLPYLLEAVPWSPCGFVIKENKELSASKHPFHLAGAYYLQEPSAMAVAEVLTPEPGERVLDLCAAPGGKSTHIVCLMKNRGLLVANETHPQRAWELVKNLERWGARNTVILNEHPTRLAALFQDFFDKVLVDAPCSGEGMFRKSENARREWSYAQVQSCALRQLAILKQAAQTVRPGGTLVYSTCTFNPQENEEVVYAFLKEQPHFELANIPQAIGFSRGRADWIHVSTERVPLERAIRLWPHLCQGEGHFIAAMVRRPQLEKTALASHIHGDHPAKLPVQMQKIIRAFLEEHFTEDAIAEIEAHQMYIDKDGKVYLLPEPSINLAGLSALQPGWWLGSLIPQAGKPSAQFLPSHALAMGIQAQDFRFLLRMSIGSDELQSFLRGENLRHNARNGWLLAVLDEFSLGWLKGVQGVLKNHLPRGLRLP